MNIRINVCILSKYEGRESMAIYNPDGSEYKPSGEFVQYKPKSGEHDVFNSWDQEAIKIGGAPLHYYEIFINVSEIDELYVEARDKLWSQHPISVYGYFDPVPSQNFMSVFGIDSPEEMMFEFNYRYILNAIGHAPKIGARIYSPHKNQDWVIIQRNVQEFKLWGELRLQVMCTRFQESLTTGEGKVSATRKSDFTVNSVKDLGRGKTNFAGGQSGPE